MKWLEHRIPPPIAVLITVAIMWLIARTTYVAPINQMLRYAAAALLLVAGVSIVLLAMSRFRRVGTTINPVEIERASSLVTDGLFQFTRNPMYVGLCVILTGVAVWLSSPFALLGLVIFVLFISRFQIQPEERAMRTLFGNAYEDYCRRTRRWI
jgi:protein-S-isoprenylcysteine O-methyltransferase Ste14